MHVCEFLFLPTLHMLSLYLFAFPLDLLRLNTKYPSKLNLVSMYWKKKWILGFPFCDILHMHDGYFDTNSMCIKDTNFMLLTGQSINALRFLLGIIL